MAKIDTFEDRNQVNAKIRILIALAETLRYASKLIYQTARGARAMVAEVATNKTLSSFPEIINLLESADRVALDDPMGFGGICKQVATELYSEVADLEEEREAFTKGKLPNRLKGLVDG